MNNLENTYVDIKIKLKDVHLIKNALITAINPSEDNIAIIKALNKNKEFKDLIIKFNCVHKNYENIF